MGTFGIFKTGESGMKNHSSKLRIESTVGLALTNNTGQPQMAFELSEIGGTELEAIPNMGRCEFQRLPLSGTVGSSISSDAEIEECDWVSNPESSTITPAIPRLGTAQNIKAIVSGKRIIVVQNLR